MRGLLIGMSVGVLAVGLALPRTAIRSAHALVALLAITILVALIQPALVAWEVARARPFVPAEPPPPRSVAPAVILELTDDLAAAGGDLSPKVKRRIRAIAVGRLLDHHRSTGPPRPLDDLEDLVSPTLAAIIAADDAEPVDVGELDSLLTEIERL